jgi:hypothetical protein
VAGRKTCTERSPSVDPHISINLISKAMTITIPLVAEVIPITIPTMREDSIVMSNSNRIMARVVIIKEMAMHIKISIVVTNSLITSISVIADRTISNLRFNRLVSVMVAQ